MKILTAEQQYRLMSLTREEREQVWYEEELRRRTEDYFCGCAFAFVRAGMFEDARRNLEALERLRNR